MRYPHAYAHAHTSRVYTRAQVDGWQVQALDLGPPLVGSVHKFEVRMHAHSRSFALTHTRSCTRTHACTHARMHACMHAGFGVVPARFPVRQHNRQACAQGRACCRCESNTDVCCVDKNLKVSQSSWRRAVNGTAPPPPPPAARQGRTPPCPYSHVRATRSARLLDDTVPS